MLRLWAIGKVPYATAGEVFSSPALLSLNVFWVMVMPLWRDLHFYIAHRFIHIRAIYKYVHSLHHRNADPEPFSGSPCNPDRALVLLLQCLLPCPVSVGAVSVCFLLVFLPPGNCPSCRTQRLGGSFPVGSVPLLPSRQVRVQLRLSDEWLYRPMVWHSGRSWESPRSTRDSTEMRITTSNTRLGPRSLTWACRRTCTMALTHFSGPAMAP